MGIGADHAHELSYYDHGGSVHYLWYLQGRRTTKNKGEATSRPPTFHTDIYVIPKWMQTEGAKVSFKGAIHVRPVIYEERKLT